jgi:hypothetical protein
MIFSDELICRQELLPLFLLRHFSPDCHAAEPLLLSCRFHGLFRHFRRFCYFAAFASDCWLSFIFDIAAFADTIAAARRLFHYAADMPPSLPPPLRY